MPGPIDGPGRNDKIWKVIKFGGSIYRGSTVVVLIEVVNEDFEQHKLFYLVPKVKYYGSAVGI